MGICQDLAATAVAMLRSQNIPAKLMIGKADNQNHAWVSTTINNKEILFDPTKEIEKKKNAKKYAKILLYQKKVVILHRGFVRA